MNVVSAFAVYWLFAFQADSLLSFLVDLAAAAVATVLSHWHPAVTVALLAARKVDPLRSLPFALAAVVSALVAPLVTRQYVDLCMLAPALAAVAVDSARAMKKQY